MSTPVEKIKERLNIVDLLGTYLKLEKAGKNMKARCPFHNEKTPSFFVSPDRDSYYCFGCFPPGQLVKTPFGYHPIETLDKKHHVLSGKGFIRKILATQHRNYQGDLISIKLQKLYGTVSLTSDHRLPIIRPKTKYFKKVKQFYRQCRGYLSRDKRYTDMSRENIEKHASIMEVSSGELKFGDFVLYPIPNAISGIKKINLKEYLTKRYTKGPKVRVIPYNIKIDDNLLKLIGYYIAEGSSHQAYIRFSLGNHEEKFAQEIIDLIKNIFGLKASIFRCKTPKTGLEVTACHSYLAEIFANLCGDGSNNKHIPFLFQELLPEQQMVLVNAIYKGDGYVIKSPLTSHKGRGINVVSQLLIEQITDILLRNNFFPSVWSGKAKVDKMGVNHQEVFSIKWSETANTKHTLVYTDGDSKYWLLPIKSMTKKHYEGPVYNLTVDEDHSYVTKNFAVSNCGKKGDIFTFVQEFEGVDFFGALKMLAERTGVVLERGNFDKKDDKEAIFNALEAATQFFEANLPKSNSAQKYLEKRGLTEKTIKDWRIGFVSDDWRTLYDYLSARKFTDSEIEQAGLIKRNESRQDSFYDRFRGRIMFPIRDSVGRVVGFSGRILPENDDGKSAKYLNSPETAVFNKSRLLYGFDLAKLAIKKFDYAVIVEGQMDIIMCHQAGFQNVVATSGTALTPEHLTLLRRISNRVIMAFDADRAGFNAATKAWQLALSLGMEVKIAEFKEGKDPAEVILGTDGKEKFKEALKESMHIIDFYLSKILSEGLDERKLGKEIQEKLLPFLALIESSIEKSHWVKKIADKCHISETAIWEDLKKVKVEASPTGAETKSPAFRETATVGKIDSIEKRILGIINWQEKDSEQVIDVRKVKEKVKEIIGEGNFIKWQGVTEQVLNEATFEAEQYYEKKKLQGVLDELLMELEKEYITKELAKAKTPQEQNDLIKRLAKLK